MAGKPTLASLRNPELRIKEWSFSLHQGAKKRKTHSTIQQRQSPSWVYIPLALLCCCYCCSGCGRVCVPLMVITIDVIIFAFMLVLFLNDDFRFAYRARTFANVPLFTSPISLARSDSVTDNPFAWSWIFRFRFCVTIVEGCEKHRRRFIF